MRKIIYYAVLATIVLICKGCHDTDYWHTTIYTYKNQCSTEIIFKSMTERIDYPSTLPNITIEAEAVLAVGESITFEFITDGGWAPPFHWRYHLPDSGDYTTISNGDKIVTYRYKDQIYKIERYAVVSEGKRATTFLWVFTDADFENGVPIEDE